MERDMGMTEPSHAEVEAMKEKRAPRKMSDKQHARAPPARGRAFDRR
jgi:hypothetical protein